MNISLDRMNAHWVRYSNYEWKPDEKNYLYLTKTSHIKSGCKDA